MMKLLDAVKQYEECMNNLGSGCLVENCPLHKEVKIDAGGLYDEKGRLTWKISGCSLLGMFETWLKSKRPGTPYPEDSNEQ